MIASANLQRAVFARLNGSITGTVHDEVPATATAPYTVVGETTDVPWDFHDAGGSEETITVHTFSSATSSVQVKDVMTAIDGRLHGWRFTLADGKTGWLAREFSAVNKEDVDGKLMRHGVLRFRAFYS